MTSVYATCAPAPHHREHPEGPYRLDGSALLPWTHGGAIWLEPDVADRAPYARRLHG